MRRGKISSYFARKAAMRIQRSFEYASFTLLAFHHKLLRAFAAVSTSGAAQFSNELRGALDAKNAGIVNV